MKHACVALALVFALAMAGCANRRQEEERLPQLESPGLADKEGYGPSPRPAVVEEPAISPPPPEPAAPPAPAAPPPATAQTYVVQRGDTLYSIARRFYGDGKLWTRIHAANQGKYKTHNDIPVGTTLVIPPK
jgi:nucleoid-associated protein YgaU